MGKLSIMVWLVGYPRAKASALAGGALFVAALSSCSTPSPSLEEVAYASRQDGRVYVFDLKRNLVAVVGKGYLLRRDGRYLEHVGHLERCDDFLKYCLTGAFPLSVPKIMTPIARWEDGSRACRAESHNRVGTRVVFTFICRYANSEYSETFWYSRSRGIEGFQSNEPGEPIFQLVEQRGVFAE